MHCAIDHHSGLAYAEIHPDETAATGAGFLRSATAWFADHGIGASVALRISSVTT